MTGLPYRAGMLRTRFLVLGTASLLSASPLCAQDVVAYVGATLWDGTGRPPVENATLVVQDGRIVTAGDLQAPPVAEIVDLRGRWIIPGLIDTHAHVTGDWGEGNVEEAGAEADLLLYARYGVTTVLSLGGEPEAALALHQRNDDPALDWARFYAAGPVVTAETVDEAFRDVLRNAELGVDWIKIRVDDNLGTRSKMPWEAVQATIRDASGLGFRVAAHLFHLDDAKALLRHGVDLIAHSVRDTDVDEEFIGLLRERNVCYVPTLVREVSTFVYAERPVFFDDPFFQTHADTDEVARVTQPEFQRRMRESTAAARNREALLQAQRNVKRLVDAGVKVSFGTDAGQPARFPGEHLELGLMVNAGLTPEQALRSATGVAAECLGLPDVGTLETGNWADFLVLSANPLDRVENTRHLEAVYVAGNRVP